MFLFLRLHDCPDSYALIRTKAVEAGVIALPGVVREPIGGIPFAR
jgi:hypothetical protein